MAGVYRESTRVYRDRAGSESSDDGGYKTTTVRRYKVAPSRVIERTERVEVDDDDRRSRYSGLPLRTSGDFAYAPERPRSAFDSRSVVERQVVERELEPYRAETRSVYDKEWDRGSRYDDSRNVIEVERERERVDWDRRSRGGWDHHHHHHHHHDDTEVVVDKRIERREDGDIKIEKRIEEHRDDYGGAEVERYRKETEYYSPVSPPPIPQPVIIRQQAPEQKIIVQEAPPPAPIIVPRQDPGIVVVREREQPREIVRREPREDESYYYRRETKAIGPYRKDEREYWDRRGRGRDCCSDDEDYHYKKTIIRRERSNSSDHHHKRHLAEGALAGAGIAALVGSRRDSRGELPANRGSKVLAGAALGGLGTEIIRRARSAYEENYRDDYYDSRHRSRSRSHSRSSRIKTGLGIAAAALAVAGAAKYYQSNKIEKEEMSRGRSRNRGYSASSYSSRSRSRSKSRKSRSRSVAKAAAATAAAAGLVQHFRNKSKSKSRSRSRSKSRLRTGAEIAAAGLAGGVASKIYKNRKDKKDREIERELSDEEYEEELRRERRARRRSRSRSQARSLYSEPRSADPELGLVEYGTAPLPSEPPYPPDDGYESAANERRRRRHRHDDYDDPEPAKKRSKSRLRDMAAAAVGTGAAAIGIKQYQKSKEKEEDRKSRERDARSRSRDRSISRDRRYSRDRTQSRDRARDRDRERSRRREHSSHESVAPGYEDDIRGDGYYDDYSRPPSPPHASGGAFYPPPPAGAAGFTQHPDLSTTNLRNQYPPYPQGPSSMGPSPPMATGGAGGYPPPGPPPGPPPAGGPPPGTRFGPDHVSEDKSRSASPQDAQPVSLGPEDGVKWRERARKFIPPGLLAQYRFQSQPPSRSPSPSVSSVSSVGSRRRPSHSASKSVTFIPLSPQSSQTLRRHHLEQEEHATEEAEKEKEPPSLSEEQLATLRPVLNRRRSYSDPSSSRSLGARRNRGGESPLNSDSEVENLPDRFDSQGRPLGSTGAMRWRQGMFEYQPRSGNGWHSSGAWAVGGTHGDAVQRIASDIEGIVTGQTSWKSLLKDVVGVVQDTQGHHGRIDDGSDEERPRRRRRRRSE
ncbi:hypothetical protein CMUS01_15482 [Colletotrichum musicola]|uniref:DUF3824 domain-containing protein n=1 Tax=Colletotrichum musicola TaxID=2175873 RepID=A0A8H6IWS8_9PEZI|nr:hypothetical protein CMUS01_15482 [Colletotrichum musicola]